MVERRLTLALENLVSRGELSPEDANKVGVEYEKTNHLVDSRRRVLAEVGGYLGGLFIVVSLVIILGQRWHNISHLTLFSLFLVLAILQAVAALIIGKSSGVRSRLAGLLGATSASCATLSVIALRAHGNGVLTFAIFAGWLITLCAYIWNRTMIGELSLAGFSITVGISGIHYVNPHFQNYSYIAGSVLVILGFIWLVLSNIHIFDRRLGDALAMGMLLWSGQIVFFGSYRFLTYLIYLALVLAALWIYSRAPEWPLLVGAIAAITIGAGEFVGETLGGSLGATFGLLTSGILFVSGSVYSFKRSKRIAK